jgi:hypothetical protein
MIAAPTDSTEESLDPLEPDPIFMWVRGGVGAAARLDDIFKQAGRVVLNVDDPLIPELTLPAVARALQLAGVSAVTTRSHLQPIILDALRKIVGDAWIEDEADLLRFLEEHQ